MLDETNKRIVNQMTDSSKYWWEKVGSKREEDFDLVNKKVMEQLNQTNAPTYSFWDNNARTNGYINVQYTQGPGWTTLTIPNQSLQSGGTTMAKLKTTKYEPLEWENTIETTVINKHVINSEDGYGHAGGILTIENTVDCKASIEAVAGDFVLRLVTDAPNNDNIVEVVVGNPKELYELLSKQFETAEVAELRRKAAKYEKIFKEMLEETEKLNG